MAAPPPPADALDNERDYQALLCSLLEPHLFASLDRADKLAVRGVSVQLRDEADRCFRSLDCLLRSRTTWISSGCALCFGGWWA